MGTILKEIRSAYMQGVSAKDLEATGKYNKTTITLNYSVMRRGGYIFGSRPEGWDKSVLPTGTVLTAVIPEHNHLVVEGVRKALSKAKEQGIAKEAILLELDALFGGASLATVTEPMSNEMNTTLSGRVSVTSVLEALNEEETEPVSEAIVPEDLVGRAVKFKVGAVSRTGRVVSLEEEGGEYVFNVRDGKERNFKLTQDKFVLINE